MQDSLHSYNVEILVLDFGSQYTQLIARRLREYGIYTEIVPYFEKLDSIRAKNPKGIILSGGPASVYEEGAYKPDSRVFELGIPVLGICYGMQYIAHFFGGSVVRAEAQEFGKAVLEIAESSVELFEGVKQDSIVWMSHADKVESLPNGFVELAKSGNTHYCAIADFTRQVYALQFHPEVVHSECGGEILKNFAVGICGADTSWNMRNFAESEIAKLREKVLGFNVEGFAMINRGFQGEGGLLNINDRADNTESTIYHAKPTQEIDFKAITDSNFSHVCALNVCEEQKRFIESNLDSINEAKKLDYWETRAIYTGSILVGFVMYGYVPVEDRVWVDRFMIDGAFSGKGIGSRAFTKLIDELFNRFKKDEIYLSVYEENTLALRFYKKLGFEANGEKDINDEMVLTLSKEKWRSFESLSIAQGVGVDSNNCHVDRSEISCVDSNAEEFSKNSKLTQENSKIFDEKTSEAVQGEAAAGFFSKCGLQEKSQGSLLNINDRSDFSQLPHLSQNEVSLEKTEFSKVLCAVSGGVDSSVVATLLYRAIGENLIPVFVDTGLLRKGEREAVEAMFRENLKVPLIVADARELFLGRLKGVTDPEQKRKIIGETFIEVFEAEAKKHNTKGEIKFLAQGTLYPDVIESVSVKGPSKTIKSHHNVGGLPEWMKFELIEPLRELFKDEVRALGRELGMPESMLMRHPFPGPGLAIRIMGEVNAADLELLKEADSIFIEELHKWGLYDSVWQAFCVLLNVRSVGVMGDNRTYDNTICVRAVEAMDGMTASFSHLPHAFLESVSNRIINEVAGINRVVYDITSKPPGTIEWE